LVTAALALREALTRPRAEILLLAPSENQSAELLRKIVDLYDRLGRPLEAHLESEWRLKLANRSRILALPAKEATVRCFSGVHFMAVDEAARVKDELYFAVRPMLATVGGRLICLSSAYARLGFFYNAWESDETWNRVRVTAEECPRLSPEFLAEERRALGPRWFSMEYETAWGDLIDAVFSSADVTAACGEGYLPLFG
jgi:hypothetical protein